jgi:hypothetical protein
MKGLYHGGVVRFGVGRSRAAIPAWLRTKARLKIAVVGQSAVQSGAANEPREWTITYVE